MRTLWEPTFLLAFLLAVSVTPPLARAAKDTSALRDKIADKLPEKAKTKRTYVDFSSNETPVVSKPRETELERILKSSDRDMRTPTVTSATTIRSRKILAAPEGDSAEPIAAMTTAMPEPVKISTKSNAPIKSLVNSPPTPAAPVLTVKKIEHDFAGPLAPTLPVSPPLPIEPFTEFQETAKVSRSVARPTIPTVASPAENSPVGEAVVVEMKSRKQNESPSTFESRLPRRELGDGFLKSIDAKSMVFIRAGVFNAGYKKFDDRMKNSATSMGLAAARGLETTWGEFEVRAAFDIYHSMDQSVTIDNIRMFTARTEVAYWFSHSRVKPGLSLGLGMADYSIRSYRAISDSNENTVTLKTHAKSRAFSVIPATSLRVELAKELVIDTQAEFLALLGGESTDAAQGLGVNVSLGWMF